MKEKSSILISVGFFFGQKNSKTLYTGHLVIPDSFLGAAGVCYRQVWLYLHVFVVFRAIASSCIASFNFNLNGVEAESILLKKFSVLKALQV